MRQHEEGEDWHKEVQAFKEANGSKYSNILHGTLTLGLDLQAVLIFVERSPHETEREGVHEFL